MSGFKAKRTMTCEAIHSLIAESKIEILGDSRRIIDGISSLEDAKSNHLAFCSSRGKDGYEKIMRSDAGAIFCSSEVAALDSISKEKTLLLVEDPMLCFTKCLKFMIEDECKVGIHHSVVIGKDCRIHASVYIGPYAVVEDMVEIGENAHIESGVKICSRVRIGKKVKIRSNCSIGVEGLAYARDEMGEYEELPHLGTVRLGDGVDIGANTCIVRGILQDTVIETGTKIGNQVNIGPNVHIGKNSLIGPAAVLCGGCRQRRSKEHDSYWQSSKDTRMKQHIRGRNDATNNNQ
jgi:UDP-3-O-[3-hydroxymyristoyl] glucosamine N-acyltransferase